MIVSTKAFENHINHPKQRLMLFTSYNIRNEFTKTFLAYTEIDRLDKQIYFIRYPVKS